MYPSFIDHLRELLTMLAIPFIVLSENYQFAYKTLENTLESTYDLFGKLNNHLNKELYNFLQHIDNLHK